MNILVTGGAGYIGSICVEELIKQNHTVIVIDNLQEGHRNAINLEAIFYKGNIGDNLLLDKIFRKHDIEVVMHFAAETLVEVSMSDPQVYFQNNVVNGLTLINAMNKYQCKKIIFSSSAAIFGNPIKIPIDENHPTNPINAYGESKLMFEKILKWYYYAYGFCFNSFRYFNAAGATKNLGEAHKNETHLIPIIINTAIDKKNKLTIYGTDYETKDGTCVRDYIHVLDIVQAHIKSLHNLEQRPCAKYNLGNGEGFTNLEVVKMVEQVSGKRIAYEFSDRRAGDPDTLIASSNLVNKEIGWKPNYTSLEKIVSSAYEWHVRNTNGYNKNK